MTDLDLKAWVDGLVMTDPIETTRIIGQRCATVDWEALDDEQIRALSGILQPFIDRLAGRLRVGLRQSSLPLTEEGRQQLDSLLRLYRHSQFLLNLELNVVSAPDLAAAQARIYRDQVAWAARMILDCYVSYVDVPNSLFVDLHQLADTARVVLTAERPEDWLAVRRMYLALVLLAMVNPYGLTREEMEDVFVCLQRVADWVEVVHERPSDTSRFLDLTGKMMPHIALTPRSDLAGGGVFVDVGALYRPATTENLPESCHEAMRVFLERLHFYIVRREGRVGAPVPAERQSEPTSHQSLITLGFVSVHHRLELLDEQQGQPRSAIALAGLDWEGLDQPIRGQVEQLPGLRDFKMDIQSRRTSAPLGWDDVDLDGLPSAAKPHRAGAPPRVHKPEKWDLVNLSAGGFRLHWRLARDSHAAVDELILAEVPPTAQDTEELGLGVVRWVRHLGGQNRTIDMGVEKITGRVLACYAHDQYGHGVERRSWPAIARTDDDRHVEWVLVPLQLVASTNEVMLALGERLVPVRLGSMRLSGQGFAMMEAISVTK